MKASELRQLRDIAARINKARGDRDFEVAATYGSDLAFLIQRLTAVEPFSIAFAVERSLWRLQSGDLRRYLERGVARNIADAIVEKMRGNILVTSIDKDGNEPRAPKHVVRHVAVLRFLLVPIEEES